jgi:hypothetical protein
MTKRVVVLLAIAAVAVWAVSATCEDCDTAARHFLRQLFRAVL